METLAQSDAVNVGDTVTVFRHGTEIEPAWEALGNVLATAPFSVLISYLAPRTQEHREDWFRLLNAKRHGDTDDIPVRYRPMN
jgi:hypothetical protein